MVDIGHNIDHYKRIGLGAGLTLKHNGQYYKHKRQFRIIILTIMPKTTTPPLPALQRLLAQLGENIRLARLRRRFSASLVAERAGMARNTLRSIERGDPNVTLGAYVNVLLCLGLSDDLKLIARDDDLGHKLQDAGLPTRARAPRLKAESIDRGKSS